MPRPAAMLLLMLVVLSGCSQSRYQFGAALPEAGAEDLGGSSLASVLARLGPPLRLVTTGGGLVMAWESWEVTETSLGLSLGFVGADLLEADWGDAQVSGDFLLISFDRARRVTGAYRARRRGDIGGGAALQPLAGFVSVVDVEDLLHPLPQHLWGAGQLLSPSQVLNNAQRPGMGDSALEQRATPLGAGQHSLGWPE